MQPTPNKIVLERVVEPAELAAAHAQRQQFDKNAKWLRDHAREVYTKYRGKCLCIAGEEVFVAESSRDALAQATAAHPHDMGRFIYYVPKEKVRAFMRIDGEWFECDDGIVRPIIRGALRNAHGFWEPVPFLVDSGADQTVLSSAVLDVLGFAPGASSQLGGVGGMAETVEISNELRLLCDDGGLALFRSRFAAFTQLESLDMCVLGRDIIGMFAAIVDQPGSIVSLIADTHRYAILAS